MLTYCKLLALKGSEAESRSNGWKLLGMSSGTKMQVCCRVGSVYTLKNHKQTFAKAQAQYEQQF